VFQKIVVNMEIIATAPAKAILFGEPFEIHGKPVIVTAITHL